MQERKFYLPDQQNHFITDYALDKLLKQADGNICLTYLYFLRQRGDVTIPQAEEALRLTEQQIHDAIGQLKKIGLISGGNFALKQEKIVEKAEETPQYSAEELRREKETDKAFASLLKEVERVLGKVLTAPDLNILMGIYRHLGMPAEVIYQMVCHLTAEHKERYGQGRVPTMRGIEKIAYIWVRDEIITLEAAMQHIEKRKTQQAVMGQLKKIMNLQQGSLSPSQENYLQTWISMGFAFEVIAKAYDKTLIQAGQMKWAYMHAILKNWQEKGLFSIDAVAQEDSGGKKALKSPAQQKNKVENVAPSAQEIERRKKRMQEMEGLRHDT